MGKQNEEKNEEDFEFSDKIFCAEIIPLLEHGCSNMELFKKYCDINVRNHREVNDLVGAYLKSKELKLTAAEGRDFYKGVARDALMYAVNLLSAVHAMIETHGSIMANLDSFKSKYEEFQKETGDKDLSFSDFVSYIKRGPKPQGEDSNDTED